MGGMPTKKKKQENHRSVTSANERTVPKALTAVNPVLKLLFSGQVSLRASSVSLNKSETFSVSVF